MTIELDHEELEQLQQALRTLHAKLLTMAYEYRHDRLLPESIGNHLRRTEALQARLDHQTLI